jgi:hypothetical protein
MARVSSTKKDEEIIVTPGKPQPVRQDAREPKTLFSCKVGMFARGLSIGEKRL